MFALTAHETTRREYRSSMIARYSHPSSVQMAVTSVAQTRLGAETLKLRATTFGAIGSECFESVVFLKRRFRRACRPFSYMSRSTRFFPTRTPWARNSA